MRTLKPQTLLILNAVILTAIFAAILLIFWQQDSSQAETKYPAVSDFALLDQQGKFHKLSRYANARGVVLYVYGVGCPIARNHLPALKKLRDEYKKQGIEFLLLNNCIQPIKHKYNAGYFDK